MNKNIFMILIVSLFLTSCGPGYEPTNPNIDDIFGGTNSGEDNNTTDEETTTNPPIANFSYTTAHPLKVILKNKSSNASSYRWDFGDGNVSTEKNPTHKYNEMGVYRVKLYAYGKNAKVDTYETNVTVENPDYVYFAGITYEKLSVNNKYIKFKLTDDDFFTTTWANSVYKLISTANMPYEFILQDPVLMDGLHEDDWYLIEIFYSNSDSGNGTKLAGFKFYTSTIYNGYPETIRFNENQGNKITCHFKYK